MSALLNEQLISLTEAARSIPPIGGVPVAPGTVWRWCMRGCRGRRLEVVRRGGRLATTREAVQRFLEAVQGPPGGQAPGRALPLCQAGERRGKAA